MRLPLTCLPVGLLIFNLLITPIRADDSLSVRIDQLIDAEHQGPVSTIASDLEFLRRVTLDLHGVIPSSNDARSFAGDSSPNKREQLVDRLIANPRYAVHMATVFDVMLMERRPDKNVTTVEWQSYLQSAFEKNIPFNQLAREILGADGVDPAGRPAARFYLDRDAEPHLLTRDIGRIFFGMDLQCAQCHDHPIVDHYLQTDYYGLYAFVNRTVLFVDPTSKKSFLGEKSDGDASYKSVFTNDAGNMRPQLPGDHEIDEPRHRQGEDYLAAPLPSVRPVPKYSRRVKLAELATNGANHQFNVNITNRLWAHMMGRGLVHPVDLHHPLNPPSNPALLNLLATEFVRMNYDVKRLFREIAVTKAYQRSIDVPPVDSIVPKSAVETELVATLVDQQSLNDIVTESKQLVESALSKFQAVRATLATAETAWRTAEAAVSTAKKPLDDSLAAVAKAQGEAAAKQAAISAINEAAAKSTEAAKLLPNDKDVASAVATFTAKQQQLKTELTAIEKTIADTTAAQPPLQAKLVEAYPPADAAFAAYLEARKPVDEAKAELNAVWKRYKADSLADAIQKKRASGFQSQVALQDTLNGLARLKTSVELQTVKVAEAAKSVEQQQAEIAAQAKVVSDIQAAKAGAEQTWSEAKSKSDAKQAVVQTVTEAIGKTEAALQMLAGDAELTQAAQKLKERLEPLKKEAADLVAAAESRETMVKEVASKLTVMNQGLTAASNEMAVRQQAMAARKSELDQAMAEDRRVATAIVDRRQQLVEMATVTSGIRTFKQLWPEQLAWSTLQATGGLDPQRASAEAEIEKAIAKAAVANDAALAMSREMKVEHQLNEQMRGQVAPYVTLYASSPGQPQDDFFATPDQALFVANGGTVIGWAAGGQLSQKLMAIADGKSLVEELYLSTLTRLPTESETATTVEFLKANEATKAVAIRDLIWSLLTSAEFRFNH